MNGSTDEWMAAAVDWLDSPPSTQLPPHLAESIGTASAPEIQSFTEVLLGLWDDADASSLAPDFAKPDWGFGPHDFGASDFGTRDLDLDEEGDGASNSYESQSGTGKNGANRQRALRLRALLQLVAARVLRVRLESGDERRLIPSIAPSLLKELAHEVLEVDSIAAAHCLQILAAQGDSESLETLCEMLKQPLLADEHGVAVAISPLFQWPPRALADLFDKMGEDAWRWQLVGPLLDLAGHTLRKGALRHHPFSNQADRLRELLSGTVQRLSQLEENPQQFGQDVPTIQRVLSNAISLTVSLCDAIGLVGDRAAEGKLNQAMGLSHRRVQTEAAGALARLGFSDGKKRLLELAADPLARLRAISYADELGMEEDVPPDLRAPKALAEAELVTWLADRDRFGVPPSELELIDERVQYWPSYDEPQPCFLWKFTYRVAEGELSNLAIAGPLTYAVRSDLKNLPLDDVYALFAGWQAEHEEIYEVPTHQFNITQRTEAERLAHNCAVQGIDDLKLLALTFFFGERAILATGKRHGHEVCCVADDLETVVISTPKHGNGLTPDLVLNMYRGRKLLRTFN